MGNRQLAFGYEKKSLSRRCRFFSPAACFVLLAALALPARAVDVAADVADPMYINKLGDFTSQTSVDFGKYFQMREVASYGFSNRFSVAADVRYRYWSKDHGNDGFSNIGVMGEYRAGSGSTGATDILFGFGFGGQGVVPNYSDEVYSVGLRTGRQWSGMTLSATIMSNWIFKNENGMAYIDLTPEAYFRMKNDWSVGLGATLRKATDSHFNQEWINVKVGPTLGFTGWFINVGYEIESEDIRVGGSVSMLF
jgi:hypothetical protein